MKNLCIDVGNTFIKIAIFENSVINSVKTFSHLETDGIVQYIKQLSNIDASIISDVSSVDVRIVDVCLQKSGKFIEFNHHTSLPIRNLYKTPQTLGKDRLAAVVAAAALFPHKDILIFDAGTALTIDFIDAQGNYHGGNISPGLNMRFKALNYYTEKLPLLSKSDDFQLFGDDTNSAITSGVQFGMVFEINSYIEQFDITHPHGIKILTGGDIFFFGNKIKSSTFAEPNLIIIGLDRIIKFVKNEEIS
jgi:type III pantothenate kinase